MSSHWLSRVGPGGVWSADWRSSSDDCQNRPPVNDNGDQCVSGSPGRLMTNLGRVLSRQIKVVPEAGGMSRKGRR